MMAVSSTSGGAGGWRGPGLWYQRSRPGASETKHYHLCSITCFLLLQSLAKLSDGFRNSFSLSDPPQELPHNPAVLGDLPQQFCDAGSQTDIIGEVCQERERTECARGRRVAFMLPSLICLTLPLSLQKCFGFCAIKFEGRIQL